MRIFNQDSAAHAWDDGINQMLGADDASRAFARNLQYEPNVTPDRRTITESLVAVARGPNEAARLMSGLKTAFLERVRHSSAPDFADHILNPRNIVPHATATRTAMHPGLEFIRVFDLTGLREVFRWALLDPSRYSIPDGFTAPDKFNDYLNDGLQIAGGAPKQPDDQRPFLDNLFKMVNDFGRGLDLPSGKLGDPRPFHPVWVTEKKVLDVEKQPDLREKPERWLQVLGVPKAAGRWLALLSYDWSAGIQLARPSLLTAEPSAYFFPTPKGRATADGGAAMDLAVNTEALVLEFVHVQQPLSTDAWKAAGSVCRRTMYEVDCDFEKARTAHRAKLANQYDLGDWMKEVV